ncbi:Phage capsid scaffolding protein [Cronobacter universalis NCTC 9529]|uniref:Phage capsid scaffolding protein (GPO) serine peptidase n=1 Tax=Cronobacter universalis NCTC 9529 TaxID=1074000 RepID=A0ABY1W5Q1_9ENTR|nr:Phage capsid scaffolding protein [Cronobacter universalis NCTC 9529]STD14936.1 Phage capsid scaffolding protein (GPO) serine peptidase [Cronobacter universalis NCTC 9529]
MAKKVSKFFRIGVEGDTCDGRVISAGDIQEMAASFDPRVYGCRINLEHLRGILPEGVFNRYGDVVELKAEKIDDDSALNGKWALFAKIAPLDNLVDMVGKGQKVYTSMEIQPNFANSGKCYLVGLAVTDDPASLGTEYLEFCRTAKSNPLNRFKASPENLISAATLAELEFEDQPETVFTALTVWRELRRLRGQQLADPRMDAVLAAADIASDWASYTELQGGPLVARRDLIVRLAYEITEQGNEYGEDVQRVQGIYSPHVQGSEVATRLVKWAIVPKLAEASAEAGFSGGAAAPWSSVNNCTKRGIQRQLKFLLNQRGFDGSVNEIAILMRGGGLMYGQSALFFKNGRLYEQRSEPIQELWPGWA